MTHADAHDPIPRRARVADTRGLRGPHPRDEQAMAGWYEVTKNDNSETWFVLEADNTQVVLRSEQNGSKGSARNGIASAQTNVALDERYELKANGPTADLREV